MKCGPPFRSDVAGSLCSTSSQIIGESCRIYSYWHSYFDPPINNEARKSLELRALIAGVPTGIRTPVLTTALLANNEPHPTGFLAVEPRKSASDRV